MKGLLLGIIASVLMSQNAFAGDIATKPIVVAPQPTTCMTSKFTSEGNQHWKNISLKITNNCNRQVEFQNATVTFQNKVKINTSFWGDFGPLSYPDNTLKISSIRQPDNLYLATFTLHFPNYQGANSKLPAGASITIKYGAPTADFIEGSTLVYLTEAVSTGSIELTNATAQPANVDQTFALVHLTMNGTPVSDVQLPWNSVRLVPGLAPGRYTLAADNINDSGGNVYQATINPQMLDVVANQTAKSTITYTQIQQQNGQVAIQLQPLPTELTGYTGKPIAQLTRTDGASIPTQLNWNTTTTVSQLTVNSVYNLTTPLISFNGVNCQPTFTPATLTASTATPPPTSHLTYACTQVAQARVTLNVTGAPASLASLKVTLTPNNGGTPVTQTVALTNGSGTNTVMLVTGVIYTVSADPVTGYNANFNPQPLTAQNNGTETITLTAQPVGTPVAQNGQLRVCGTQLCNEHGVPIQLRGMSSHGIQWYGWQGSNTEKACLTPASLDTLANTWKASVMRISMYIQEGGYETNPAAFTNQVSAIIEEATKRGIYAIVDFHQLEPGDPNANFAHAERFFTAIANAHKNKNNLLYEICNEPSGVSWTSVKSYAERLIPIIRAIDPKTPILVGTHAWSSLGVSDGRSSQDIINNPVNATNIMYVFHFYAASHKTEYLNELDRASNVLPMFVTEFGTQTYTGDGGNDFTMTDRYMELMARKKISWTNWNYSDDFRSGAVWLTNTCPNGPWTDARLKPAGAYIKGRILSGMTPIIHSAKNNH